MKKWTAVLLCSILSLSLGGCAENARSLSGKIIEKEVDINDESVPDASGITDESRIPDERVSEEAAKDRADDRKNEDASPDTEEPEKVIQKVYLQDYFGYRLPLDEDWEFATEIELEELNGALMDAADSEETLAGIINSDNLYTDMMANNTVTGNTIVIRLLQEGLADIIGSTEKRNEKLADAMYADAEAAGLKKIEKTTREVTFLGEPVTAVGVKGQMALSNEYSTEMWYQMIVKRKGEYASAIFVTGFTEFGGDNYQEILDLFEVLD